VTRAWERRRPSEASGKRLGPYREGTEEARKRSGSLLGRALATALTFHYVCLAWIFFRAPTFKQAVLVLQQLTTLTTVHPNLPPVVAALLAVGLVAHYTPGATYERVRRAFGELPAPAQGAVLFAVAVVLHEVASTAAVPFVYFQF